MGYTQPQPALPMASGHWWAQVLRGITALLFGLAALLWPGMTLLVLLVVFAVYALVDGSLAIVAGIRDSGARRWLLLAEGALGLLAGLVVLFWPGTTALVFVYVISAWAIFTGLLKVAMAVSFRREVQKRVAYGLRGRPLRALRGRPGLRSRSWARHFGVARRNLRADTRRRAGRAGLPRPGPGPARRAGSAKEGPSEPAHVRHPREAREEKEMGEGYGTLRLWSTVLMFVGVLGVIFVVIGTIFAVFAAPSFWQGVAFLLIGGPLAVLFASWPIALGQGLRALADVAEYVQRQESGL